MRPNLQETVELTTFTAEMFNGKLHFFSIKRFWKTEAKRRNLWFKNRRILVLTITKSWWVAVDSGYLKGMPKSKNGVWQLTHEFRESLLKDPNIFKSLDIWQKKLKMKRKNKLMDSHSF